MCSIAGIQWGCLKSIFDSVFFRYLSEIDFKYSIPKDEWATFGTNHICMKNIHYSVPDTLVGKKVGVKIYSDKIVMLYQGAKVAGHERVYGVADTKN